MGLKRKFLRKCLNIKYKFLELKNGPEIRLNSEEKKMIEIIRRYLKDNTAEILMSPIPERMIKIYDGFHYDTDDPDVMVYICSGGPGTRLSFSGMMIVNHSYNKQYPIPIQLYMNLEKEFDDEILKRRKKLFDRQMERSVEFLDKIVNKKM